MAEDRNHGQSAMKQMTCRGLWGAVVLVFVGLLLPGSAHAQGDGPRAHWKELLTDANVFSLTPIWASGNANPADPTHAILPGASFDASLFMAGYTRSFSLFDRTALTSVLWPVGNLEGAVNSPVPLQASARGFGDPLIQLDLNLVGAPAMKNVPDLLRYEPDLTLDLVLSLAIPIGEYDSSSPVNIGQNRWYGRVGMPIMKSLGDWVPGRRTTLEFMPAVWFFENNDDSLGQTLENDPLFQLDGHLTRDFTETMWGSLDAVWYQGAESTIAGLSGGELSDLGVGFTFGYQVNDSLMFTAGYTSTIEDGTGDLDVGVFRVNLIYGWHQLIEGINRLN